MILMIDNYDSFTYNLVQLIGGIDPDIRVVRNDALTVPEIERLQPSHIILSPGPGYPKDAGVCEDVIRALGGKFPVLGVCLGHQAICEVYGAEITHAVRLMHGKKSDIFIDTGSPVFAGLPEKIEAARYHSLIARRDTVPDALKIIAQDGMGEIMAVSHRELDVIGLQFHPESVLTPQGGVIIRNFLKIGGSSHD
ncbi:anthranilate synthase component 2 [Sporobacter termitidis DSM 10068]|uniref:Anthranilate synthase component 2 n=1 Tax=Sporobacter termitidis DSM 10068 TaxID=1123282 RepID=A0A1M5ZB74_9FIRM|nr:aminodeoxychorismate/anthranilate synthase component II [Sporobacter termitidis]SHI21449.1 anthranilate synthase component 2 [Sporobacter termitidis DSM 10068]